MADEDVKDTAADEPKTEPAPAPPSTDEATSPATSVKPAKKTMQEEDGQQEGCRKKGGLEKENTRREAPVTAPAAVAPPAAVAAADVGHNPTPATPSAPVEPVWDDNDVGGFSTYLAEWGPIILLVFLVLVLDAPGGDKAPAGATGMQETAPALGESSPRVVDLEPARAPALQAPAPDPAGGLGEMPPLRGSSQLTRSLNPIDQAPGAYYWGPASQSTETDKQAGDGWPAGLPGVDYWGPVGDSVEGVVEQRAVNPKPRRLGG